MSFTFLGADLSVTVFVEAYPKCIALNACILSSALDVGMLFRGVLEDMIVYFEGVTSPVLPTGEYF